jgi:hypothetical protein
MLSLSTAKAEYKTCTVASKIIDTVLQFYEEVGFPQDKPVPICKNNQAAISMQVTAKMTDHCSALIYFNLRPSVVNITKHCLLLSDELDDLVDYSSC